MGVHWGGGLISAWSRHTHTRGGEGGCTKGFLSFPRKLSLTSLYLNWKGAEEEQLTLLPSVCSFASYSRSFEGRVVLRVTASGLPSPPRIILAALSPFSGECRAAAKQLRLWRGYQAFSKANKLHPTATSRFLLSSVDFTAGLTFGPRGADLGAAASRGRNGFGGAGSPAQRRSELLGMGFWLASAFQPRLCFWETPPPQKPGD